MIADKAYWGRDYAGRLAAAGIRLLTPDKTRTAANDAASTRSPRPGW